MNIDYFIKKFTAIPDEKWTVSRFINENGQCCVLGLCGLRYVGATATGHHNYIRTPESNALIRIFVYAGYNVAFINNGTHKDFQQATPKARILAALEFLKGIK